MNKPFSLYFLILICVFLFSCKDPSVEIGTYSVLYDGNGSTSGEVPVDERMYSEGQEAEILDSNSLEKTDYIFDSWNTNSDGSGLVFKVGEYKQIYDADVTMFAQWSLLPPYTITYYGNGSDLGDVPIDTRRYYNSSMFNVEAHGSLGRTGFSFNNWNDKEDGSGQYYFPEVKYVFGDKDLHLYAQWYKNSNSSQESMPCPVFQVSDNSDDYKLVTLYADGSSIRYTIDGSEPTLTNGILYIGTIVLTEDTTIKAISYFKEEISEISSKLIYIIDPESPPDNPTISPLRGTYSSSITISITCPDNATIMYTLDGTTPSTTNGIVYSSPFVIDNSTDVRAIAFNDFGSSNVYGSDYVITSPNSPPSAPIITPGSGTYSGSVNCSITSDSGVSITYTIDGTEPSSTNGIVYSSPFIIDNSTDVRAIAINDFGSSSITIKNYTISSNSNSEVAAPVISPSTGRYSDSVICSITSESGTSIRYTTDGNEPTAFLGSLYNNPFEIKSDTLIKAIAFTNDGVSEISSVEYQLIQTPKYTLSVTSAEQGTVSASSGIYDERDIVVVEAFPDPGWYFFGWQKDNYIWSTTNPLELDIVSDLSLTAVFWEETSTITVSSSEGGYTSDDESGFWEFEGVADIYKSSSKAFYAFPDNGWEFKEWEINGSQYTNNPIIVNGDSNKTVHAIFEQILPILTMSTNSQESYKQNYVFSGSSNQLNSSIILKCISKTLGYDSVDYTINTNSIGSWSFSLDLGNKYIQGDITFEFNAESNDGTVSTSPITITRYAPYINFSNMNNQVVTEREYSVSGKAEGLEGDMVNLVVITNRAYFQDSVLVDLQGNWSGTAYLGGESLTENLNAEIYVTSSDAKIDGDKVISDGTISSSLLNVTRMK